ncbi:MAG: carbohydrate-binding domain-containing protein [Erysipelotrichaceae bacterium]|nr:carbohydrate-binding domain-containing protein [Erysipelotrichaceae bacterium]
MLNLLKKLVFVLCISFALSGCTSVNEKEPVHSDDTQLFTDAIVIELSDEIIKVDQKEISTDESSAVYLAHDIVYYEAGKDFTYGEGGAADAHSKEEADLHAVVHISKPGTYVLSGKISSGQIAVDLGEDAQDDPQAVVNLILNGVDITCTVAPAVIFYQVYECGTVDEESASAIVDTSKAGANVMIADDTVNTVNGSYVARIYKPGSVELNEDQTEVLDAKKLHKYDAAFYSKQSMNLFGGTEGTGVLKINAENEGLDSELHLTINGGNIYIDSGNDGINTNEDNVSVTTINGGLLNITVNGSTGEGDGIDSNGWLVINDGTVVASACGFSADAGIDSDKGIIINGGIVVAYGNMLDTIAESQQNYAVFSFSSSQQGSQVYLLKDSSDKSILECTPVNDFSIMIVSSDKLTNGTYTLWQDGVQLSGSKGQMMGNFEIGMMQKPDDMEFSEREWLEDESTNRMENLEGMKRPGNHEFSEGEFPNTEMPERNFSQNMGRPQPGHNPPGGMNLQLSTEFVIDDIVNYFINVQPAS